MATYTAVLTDAGQALIQSALNGAGAIQFTACRSGDGQLGTADPTALTALLHVVQDDEVADARQDSAGAWYVYLQIDNAGVTSGYLRREIGVFAQLADDPLTETLVVYLYAAEDTDADSVPAIGTGLQFVTTHELKLACAAGTSLSVTIDQSGVYLPLSRFTAHLAGTGAADQHPAGSLMPAGAVLPFAMADAPGGWLACDGAAVSRTTFARLFTAIGETFGAGNGTTTFNLPDLRGEFIRGVDGGRGVDAGRTLGSSQAHSLSLIHI